MKLMLRSVITTSSWKLNFDEFCNRLSQRIVLARPGAQLFDSSFYSYKIYQLDELSEQDLAGIQEQAGLTAEEVRELLESLLANILRFFVLYCVHGLRDQVVTKISKSGEVTYQLKYPTQAKGAASLNQTR
ncbi:hypothetical protein COOONC_15390 [Cooperia oncophora]